MKKHLHRALPLAAVLLAVALAAAFLLRPRT